MFFLKGHATMALLIATVAATVAPASAGRVIPAGTMRRPAAVLRQANLVADAAGRAADSERERLHYRGTLPQIQVSAPEAVNAVRLAALGFKRIPPNASGVLVQTRLHDADGTWRNFYVYDPQTHLIRFEMERLELDRVGTPSRRR